MPAANNASKEAAPDSATSPSVNYDMWPRMNFIDEVVSEVKELIYPQTGWATSYPGNIVFIIPPHLSALTSFEMYLYFTFRILDNTGKEYSHSEYVAPI